MYNTIENVLMLQGGGSLGAFGCGVFKALANNNIKIAIIAGTSIFAERFTVVDSPDEYYTIVAVLDLFEFLFHLNKRDIIDTEIWSRWKGLAKTIMTIPKFKRVWEKTKDVHTHEFREFVDSLDDVSE